MFVCSLLCEKLFKSCSFWLPSLGVFNYDAACDDDHSWGWVDGYTANRLDDQFFVGRNILVCPIVNPGQTNRPVYLPQGSVWYHFTDSKAPLGQAVSGGQEFSFYAPWDKPEWDNTAIYIREGGFFFHDY